MVPKYPATPEERAVASVHNMYWNWVEQYDFPHTIERERAFIAGFAAATSPAPAAPSEPVAWMKTDGSDTITAAKKERLEREVAMGGPLVAASYSVPLYR